ncbi:uncharacterized protein LOC141833894, partial [Curcuma longa]|uniref:uncharacterized protein LOC141833894 n=1 Tax=Curcuma longa TaxID=136217 RepID=UPI003D9DCA1A
FVSQFRRGGHRRSSPAGQSPSASGQSGSPSGQAVGPSHTPSPPTAVGPSHAPSPPTAVGPSPSPPQPSLVQSPNPSPVQSATDPHRETVVPHGDSFENSVTIIRQINRIVNNHWGGASMTYTSTPGPTKDLWWTEFKTKEMGKEPLFIETFTRTFQKKDKTWSGDRARAMKEKFDEAELAQTSADGSEPSIGNDLSIWLDVTGGSKGGRILGMGSLSRTHRVAATSSSSSTQPAMRAQINSLTEEVSHLKGIINQRDEEMREMRRQQNEEMSEMRRQQQMIMQHFQLGSAPSQLPQVPHDDDDGDDGEDDSS